MKHLFLDFTFFCKLTCCCKIPDPFCCLLRSNETTLSSSLGQKLAQVLPENYLKDRAVIPLEFIPPLVPQPLGSSSSLSIILILLCGGSPFSITVSVYLWCELDSCSSRHFIHDFAPINYFHWQFKKKLWYRGQLCLEKQRQLFLCMSCCLSFK